MSRIKELRERQAKLVNDARDCLDQVTDDTDEARAKELEASYDAAMAEHDRIEDQVTRLQRLEGAEARQREIEPDGRAAADRAGKEGADDEPSDKDVFVRAMQFGVDALPVEQRHRMATLRTNLTPEMRAQSTTPAAGGYTIPQGFLPEIEIAMKDYGPMLDPGVTRVLNTDTGNRLPWPTADDTANKGALVAENTQITEQDVTFAERELGAYLYSSLIVRVSVQLLQDSAFSMDDLLRQLFGERIGRIANEHLTVGTGTAQPNGIVTASTAGHTASAGTAISFDDLIELEHSVDPAYRRAPTTRWMWNDVTLKLLRKLKDLDGNYIWQPADARTGAPASVLDHPYVVNQDMADVGLSARSALFGDFNKYIVRRVQDFMLMRLVERYADFLQVGFLAFNRIDGELSNTAAVKHLVHPAT